MEEYNPDNQESIQSYLINSNKELNKKINKILPKIQSLEKDLEKEEDDHDNTERKITYLRGLLVNEYAMRKEIYEVCFLLKEERSLMIAKFNRYVFFKQILFFIVLASTPMAWAMKLIMHVDVFAAYLTLSGICCLFYFVLLPEFVFESSVENKIPKKADILLKKYKEHVKNTSYLEELANNC
jgi:hypothetical protein